MNDRETQEIIKLRKATVDLQNLLCELYANSDYELKRYVDKAEDRLQVIKDYIFEKAYKKGLTHVQ